MGLHLDSLRERHSGVAGVSEARRKDLGAGLVEPLLWCLKREFRRKQGETNCSCQEQRATGRRKSPGSLLLPSDFSCLHPLTDPNWEPAGKVKCDTKGSQARQQADHNHRVGVVLETAI